MTQNHMVKAIGTLGVTVWKTPHIGSGGLHVTGDFSAAAEVRPAHPPHIMVHSDSPESSLFWGIFLACLAPILMPPSPLKPGGQGS
jgi:hypothetical protein